MAWVWTMTCSVLVLGMVACAESTAVPTKKPASLHMVSSSTGHESGPVRQQQDEASVASSWIRSFAAKVAPLSRRLNLAYWKLSTAENHEDRESVARLEEKIRSLFSDKTRFKWLEKLSAKEKIGVHALRRQLQLLKLEFQENQVPSRELSNLVKLSASVEQKFSSLRLVLDGEKIADNEIYQMLAVTRDVSLRHKVWEAFLQKARLMRKAFLDLVRARNAVARAAGARDYFQLRLMMDEVDEQKLLVLCQELLEQSEGAFEKLSSRQRQDLARHYGVALDEVGPWLMDDPFSRRLVSFASVDLEPLFRHTEPVTLAQKTFGALGTDMGAVLGRSDLLERPGKSPGSFCLDLDRQGDVRILANVRPGKVWTSAMLHEFGHVAYLLGIDPQLPWFLRRPAADFVSEAVAMMSQDMIWEPGWLEQVLGVSSPRLALRKKRMLASRRDQMLLSLRFYLMMIEFERQMYANPEQDLGALWWKLAARYQGMGLPEGVHTAAWPMPLHLVQAPVYFYNYLLGMLLASQFRATLSSGSGRIFSRKLWDELRQKVFSKGALWRWDELVEKATGSSLDISFFLDDTIPGFRGREHKSPEEAK